MFTLVTILVYPNTKLQFILEVVACYSGLGAVLPQCSGPQGKLQPCAFFSHHLTLMKLSVSFLHSARRETNCVDRHTFYPSK